MNAGTQRLSRRGMTLTEVLVSLTVIAILVGLLVPAIMSSRERARRLQCVSNLRNLSLAIIQFDETHHRLPGAGYFHDPVDGEGNGNVKMHHNWVVLILPFLEQGNLYAKWDLDEAIDSENNRPLSETSVPSLTCPADVTTVGSGDLSYVVNGGWGFTTRTSEDVGDCPVDAQGQQLDLNGDGRSCSGNLRADNLDRKRFKQLGLFFVENWRLGQHVRDREFTERFYSLGNIIDGATQTFLMTENIRTGFDRKDDLARFSNPHPTRTMFFVGSPCKDGDCITGNVDYQKSNSGGNRINSGLERAEGASTSPNSYHPNGVNMVFADGHLKFLSELIDGNVYASLASPQGMLLGGTPIEQVAVSGDQF